MIDSFQFNLPNELIAQSPVYPRDSARLLVYERSSGRIHNDYFYNLDKYLPDQTCLVVNNSKVENCRLLFDEGNLEIFIIETVNNRTVRALVRPGKKFKFNSKIQLSNNIFVEVNENGTDGIRTLTFSKSLNHPDILNARHVPLPPYIKQDDSLSSEYQTIYAQQLGSKAAPTAGLHFTNDLITKLQSKYKWAEITLHVGLGTFASLTDDNLNLKKLHKEYYEISKEAAKQITSSSHVTAIGTTSVRTIESAYFNKKIKSGKSSTDIFILPGYEFKCVNSLITNFHLPGTSLLYLVAAFLGSMTDLETLYKYAIQRRYRFYSFGDAMLIL